MTISVGKAKVILTRACTGLANNHCNFAIMLEVFFRII